MTVTQRLRRSWTSWLLKRTLRQEAKAATRLELLQLEVSHQLLLTKELEQQHRSLAHRLQEMQEAREFLLEPANLERRLSAPEM
jgi:hypothetical protein